jgi:hypothetical protein
LPQYLPDSLQVGLDSIGRPSGEAWLTFSSPEEALRAVRDLNRQVFIIEGFKKKI